MSKSPEMLGIPDVAKLLQCSERHVTNLRKEGRIPPPVKLGTLVRWPRKVIEDWIAAGCPAMADVQRGRAEGADDRKAA
jgi:predicted DNA-binding transcriptional regulator AlpA